MENEIGVNKEKALADLQVIKQMIEQTREKAVPGMSILIFWGIWVLVGYLVTQIVIWKEMPLAYIGWGWTILFAIAVVFNAFYWPKIRRIIKGLHPYISKQIGLCWWTLVGLNLLFTIVGPFLGIITRYEQIGFLWALVTSFALCMTGIIYSKEFFFAGLCTFLGIFVAAFFTNYTWILLGVFLCLGFIIPVIVSKRKLEAVGNKNE